MESKTEKVLKVDEAGRVWTPRELRDAVLDEFERSGMPATQFAARLGVKYPTFASWVQQRRRSRGGANSLRWVEATVAAPAPSRSKSLTVQLPGGARMEVVDGAQAKMAALLLRELAAAESRVATPSLYEGGAAC
jgi:transposase-like protein